MKSNIKRYVANPKKFPPGKKGAKKTKTIATTTSQKIISAYVQQCKLVRYREDIKQRINFIQIHSCAHQLVELEEQREMEIRNTINSYKGWGRKKESKAVPSLVQKPSFTGFCTIDAIMNVSRVIGFEQEHEIEGHSLCDHKLRCKKCIYRSGICKLISGKGRKTFVELPEIVHNIDLFLGDMYCRHCLECFNSQEDYEKHGKKCSHPKKPLAIRRCLDNLFLNIDLMDWMKLSIICSVCGCEMNDNHQMYLILNSERKDLGAAFDDTLKSLINMHQLKHNACSDGSFRANYPKGGVQNEKSVIRFKILQGLSYLCNIIFL